MRYFGGFVSRSPCGGGHALAKSRWHRLRNGLLYAEFCPEQPQFGNGNGTGSRRAGVAFEVIDDDRRIAKEYPRVGPIDLRRSPHHDFGCHDRSQTAVALAVYRQTANHHEDDAQNRLRAHDRLRTGND